MGVILVTNNESIAACIAAHATEPKYKLIPVPGTELCEAECPCCGSTAHTLPQCRRWAGEAGTPLIQSLREQLDQANATITALYNACDEAHVTLWHYDLTRQPNGVDWEPVGEMQAKLVEQLWQAILLVRPEREPKS